MSTELVTTHVSDGIGNLLGQFSRSPNIKALLTVYLRQIQDIENVLFQFKTLLDLDTAVGDQQDLIGKIIGETRSGRSDFKYRIALKARVLLNKSSGTVEDIIALTQAVSGLPVNVQVDEFYPRSFIVDISEPIDLDDVDVERVATFIRLGRPVGARGVFTYHISPPFTFDGVGGEGYDEGKYAAGVKV